MADLDSVAASVISEASSLKGELGDSLKALRSAKGPFAIAASAGRCGKWLAKKIEAIAGSIPGGLGGEDKKALAIKILMGLIPPRPVWLPDFVITWMLGRVIDATVAALNKAFGKAWPETA